MYAQSFDMDIAELEQHYGSPYQGAYYEIKRALVKEGFYWIHVLMNLKNNLRFVL